MNRVEGGLREWQRVWRRGASRRGRAAVSCPSRRDAQRMDSTCLGMTPPTFTKLAQGWLQREPGAQGAAVPAEQRRLRVPARAAAGAPHPVTRVTTDRRAPDAPTPEPDEIPLLCCPFDPRKAVYTPGPCANSQGESGSHGLRPRRQGGRCFSKARVCAAAVPTDRLPTAGQADLAMSATVATALAKLSPGLIWMWELTISPPRATTMWERITFRGGLNAPSALMNCVRGGWGSPRP